MTGWFNDKETVHPAIKTAREVCAGDIVAVIPSRPEGLTVNCSVACRHAQSSAILHHRPVDEARQIKTVPMDDVFDVGIVCYVDSNRLAFAKTQKWSRHHGVIANVSMNLLRASSNLSGAIRSVRSAPFWAWP